jgi:hypothetical protein
MDEDTIYDLEQITRKLTTLRNDMEGELDLCINTLKHAMDDAIYSDSSTKEVEDLADMVAFYKKKLASLVNVIRECHRINDFSSLPNCEWDYNVWSE